ncbi:MAG TPA: Clp1/GlmU family protein [Nitrososphaera sp.]|nr:Clp1/GlmU family protein [Nitrososphaera sp.]
MPDAHKVRMIKGPAKVVVKGACHVLGSDVSWQIVKVRAGKALPFEPSNRWCRLHARLGYGARLWWANPKQAGTSMWRSLAEQISALAAGKKTTTVMLVGDTDTGKSTLAIYLANMAIRSGLVPSVIDGDIGQGDLAPPTAIGAAFLSKQVVDLRDVNTTSQLEFVGSISPIGFEGIIAKKLTSILDRTRSSLANISIVNTDGYVRNGGVLYKAMIAEELQPDAVICLGENMELFDRWQHKVPSWQILRARPSSQTYKSRLERLNRRLDQFFRYIGNGSSIAKLSQVKFDYMNKLFSPSDLFQPPIKQLEPENMTGMFVGLGSNGNVIGFGVIINVNPCNSIIHIQTNINSFDTIYLSNVRLSSDRIMEMRLT